MTPNTLKNRSENFRIKIRTMAVAVAVGVLIMGAKFLAYFWTHSNAILTDAVESVINVVAGGFALFSVYFSSIPKDRTHPYGHGKIEFLSAGFEGGLIFIAGISILFKAIYSLFIPYELAKLGTGILLTAAGGVLNLFLGLFLVQRGKKYHSITLRADGKHLLSDVYSSLGLILGLGVIYLTGIVWIDSILAIIFGVIILITGYRLIRQSLAGLLDEADYQTLESIIKILNRERREEWIDIHNMRVQKYGDILHVDCHVTFPWYHKLEKVHKEVDAIEELVNCHHYNDVEFFIHADPCRPISCPICSMKKCSVRQKPFRKKLQWKLENLLPDRHHYIGIMKEEKDH